jgi:Beta-lactamase superfamily domain
MPDAWGIPMKVTYVSHACLLIDTGRTLLATDPWFDGPAFCDQWNVFPRPVHSAEAEDASVYLISHPHEDHLHEPTLRRLCARPKRVFYPFYWYPETIIWLRSLGLGEVIEARSGRSHSIDENSKVTFVGAPGQNSIIVVESGDEVLVNVNDALHSEPHWLVDVYVRQLKRRWPKIDVMFCGFGGASYYPNALHAPSKNDQAVARLREQLFIHNFCRIAHELAPRVAIPFAADFVLLAPHQRWINTIRFSREDIPAYYRKHFGPNPATSVYAMYPGDKLVNGKLEAVSPYRAELRNGRLDHLIAQQYPQEVSAFRTTGRSDSGEAACRHWAVRLAAHLNSQAKFYRRRAINDLSFGLRLRDLDGTNWFNVRWNGAQFDVVNGNAPSLASMANIETTTTVLETSVENDWGGDALTIGYACDVTVLDSRAPRKIRLCISLLTRYPHPKSYAFTHPARTVDYLCQSAPMVLARVKSKIRSGIGRSREDEIVSSPQWLTGNIDAIRKAFHLPEELS